VSRWGNDKEPDKAQLELMNPKDFGSFKNLLKTPLITSAQGSSGQPIRSEASEKGLNSPSKQTNADFPRQSRNYHAKEASQINGSAQESTPRGPRAMMPDKGPTQPSLPHHSCVSGRKEQAHSISTSNNEGANFLSSRLPRMLSEKEQIAQMPVGIPMLDSMHVRNAPGHFWNRGELYVHVFYGPEKKLAGAARLCGLDLIDVEELLKGKRDRGTQNLEVWFKDLHDSNTYSDLCEEVKRKKEL
jgi:hypothetical protein